MWQELAIDKAMFMRYIIMAVDGFLRVCTMLLPLLVCTPCPQSDQHGPDQGQYTTFRQVETQLETKSNLTPPSIDAED